MKPLQTQIRYGMCKQIVFILTFVLKMVQDLQARLDAHMAKIDELCAMTTSILSAKDAEMADMNSKLETLLKRSASVN